MIYNCFKFVKCKLEFIIVLKLFLEKEWEILY